MRPYVICHMIESVDGRIDCEMTEKIDDTDVYYETLAKLNCDSTIEGKTTLVMHYAEAGTFKNSKPYEPAGTSFFKAKMADGYAIGVDTKGTLLWSDNVEELFDRPLIMILSEQASAEYLEYLKKKGISYITTGKDKIDLKNALEILNKEFNVQRLTVTGGGHLNGSFLHEGLIDEISMLYASGIDGRDGMAASFDGRNKSCEPIKLNLMSVEKIEDVIWAKYTIK